MTASGPPVLAVRDLVVEFPSGRGGVRALDGVSFSLGAEEILGIVGGTGSGKSLTLLSIMGLLPSPARLSSGSIRYGARELTALDADAYRDLRGREIGIVVQNAKAALNPLMRVRDQVRAVYRAKTPLRGEALLARARAVLADVGFRDVDRVLAAYPHQLSGGMAQRVLIAIALGPSPRLVLFDEPTSGLDTTIAVQAMETIRRTIREAGASAIVVTHDLGVVARYCDRVAVVRAGRVVDSATVDTFFADRTSPERRRLIDAHDWAAFGDAPGLPRERTG